MLDITNVINISVSQAPTGLGAYNVNNVALFTNETPIAEIDTYGVYVSPAAVEADWGTDSEVYAQAIAFFSQNPNVLNGNGSLIIFPTLLDGMASVGVTAGGTGYVVGDILTVTGGGGTGGTVRVDTVSTGVVTAVSIVEAGADYTVGTGRTTTGGTGSGATINIISIDDETLAEAVSRTREDIFYVGIISTFLPATAETQEATADAIQAYGDKIWIFPQSTVGAIAGIFTTIKNAGDYATRCLLYMTGDDTDEKALNSRLFAAAYAGRGFSTNFSGSNTTETMNLKNLVTINPDEEITQTIYTNAETAGVDLYADIAGISAVVSNGANKFFDQVYNLIWFVAALRVNGFNILRQTSTKVPQTEPGVSILKDAYRQICEQALTNAYIAPGSWNSPERFGNVEDMLLQIEQRGYYIYSQPVNQQSQVDREARKAPLIQIAIKEAGAIQKSNVIVNFNA